VVESRTSEEEYDDTNQEFESGYTVQGKEEEEEEGEEEWYYYYYYYYYY